METQESLIFSGLVGFLTMSFDLSFHFFLTQPMEIPTYFAMKFAVGFLVALIFTLYLEWGVFWSSVAFTLIVDAYYFGGVLILHIPGLSASPTQIIAILGWMDPLSLLALWTLFHALFYAGAALIGLRLYK
jgi:hypothetical protein